eukprot:gnl/Spiro4/16869_TR9082_c0_g1_i1.p1 gnl/Spiro4/16869_TR9082_c0_g1~~gnl/Spiro4/16869_TR9082_c0_g1_i1.p1  ORF type:complete len:456 (-),score=96.80 gnl/Spiro4/16869_TR9082_c0_g1_i1:152-1489(-)
MWWRSGLLMAFVVGVAVLVCFPRSDSVVSSQLSAWSQFRASSRFSDNNNNHHHNSSVQIPVMSFNIRLDTEESDINNHWTRRLPRVVAMFDEYRPWTVGIQELYAGQTTHLLSALPTYWRMVGYRMDSPLTFDHRLRVNDMQVAIMYDSRRLTLLHHHYHWLSPTPQVEGSKSWGSMGVRTLNVAHFSIKTGDASSREKNNKTSSSSSSSSTSSLFEILHFNTHLDVASEHARREQSLLVRHYVELYSKTYPRAAVLLTGDFNTCVGQKAYVNLRQTPLRDAWKDCADNAASSSSAAAAVAAVADSSPSSTTFTPSPTTRCVLGSQMASSFHGWLGTAPNLYGARLLQAVAFTLHGMGLTLPLKVPENFREALSAVYTVGHGGWKFPISEAVPEWPYDRMHVDWILYLDGGLKVVPEFVSLVDVRAANFSSDHFPVLAVLRISHP